MSWKRRKDGFVPNFELLQYVITTRLVSSYTIPDLGLRFIWPIYGFLLSLTRIPGVRSAPSYEDCNNSGRGPHRNPNFPRCVLEAKY